MPSHRRFQVDWTTAEPDVLAARLRRFGLSVDPTGELRLPCGTIRIVRGAGRHDRLALADPGDSASGVPRVVIDPDGVDDLLAIGLATVDRERAVASLPGESFVERPRDPHLGAWALSSAAAPFTLVLEPDTEGRLAAGLVRHGEGPAAIYLRVGPGRLSAFVADVRRRGGVASSVASGPLGPSVILRGGAMTGPHLLVVEAAAT